MPTTDTFTLTDRLVDGGLPAYLTTARDKGESHETIAFRLRSEHDIVVSSETVRRWCLRVDLAAAIDATEPPGSPSDTTGSAA